MKEARARVLGFGAGLRVMQQENREVARLIGEVGIREARVVTVIATYRRPGQLETAVRSALRQDVDDHLVIVVSDGEPIQSQLEDDPRLVTVELSRNFGAPGPVRNVGIRLTSSEFVAFLDDDNEWDPSHLRTALEGFEASDVMVYTGIRRVFSDGQAFDELATPFDRAQLSRANFVDLNAIVARRGPDLCFTRIPRKPDVVPQEDWVLAMRMSRRGSVRLIPTSTVTYLINEASYFRPWLPEQTRRQFELSPHIELESQAAELASQRFKAYPPSVLSRLADARRRKNNVEQRERLGRSSVDRSYGTIKVPASSRKAALATMAMYSPCSAAAVRFQELAARAVWIAGPRILPSSSTRWRPPVKAGVWHGIHSRLHADVGPFNGFGVYEHSRAPNERFGLLLLNEGDAVAFVKLRLSGAGMIMRELRALEAMDRERPRLFRVPELLGAGEVAGWRYVAMTPVIDGIHRPALDVNIEEIESEIQRVLSTAERPADVPDSWVPIHGDLTPWNLRRTRDGKLVLVDWEESDWGPAGSDRLRYELMVARVTGKPYESKPGDERLLEFWRERGRVGW